MRRPAVVDGSQSGTRPHAVLVTKAHPTAPKPFHLTTGYVTTALGIVGVVTGMRDHDTEDDHTRLSIVWRGRLHDRQYNRVFTERGIITLAGRFAREIVRGVGR